MGKEFYPIDLKLNVSKKIHSVDARVSREKKKGKLHVKKISLGRARCSKKPWRMWAKGRAPVDSR